MLRYILYSLLAFFIPVFLLFVFSGSLFPDDGTTSDAWVSKHRADTLKVKYQTTKAQKTKLAKKEEKAKTLSLPKTKITQKNVLTNVKTDTKVAKIPAATKMLQVDTSKKLKFPLGKETFSIPSNADLDPSLDKKLLISFKVNFAELPPAGLRQNIITKYNSKTFPYAGWGFGVSNLGTSVRPEFYWRAGNNSGGWFTFADTEILPSAWYGFSILVSQGEYASIYIEKLGASGERLSESSSKFLGGANLLGISLPVSDGPLKIGPVWGRGDGEDFKGEIASVLIGKLSEVPGNLKEFEKFLRGGPDAIKEKILESEIKLWLRG